MGLQGGKAESQVKRNVKRPNRCSALEPVLEHCELASRDTTARKECTQAAQKGIPLRILSKLRDGYVKLMNEMASGADLSGASSFYATAGPGDCPASAMVLNSSRRPSAVA